MESHRGRTIGTMAFRIGGAGVSVVVYVEFEFEDAGCAARIAGSHQAAAGDARRGPPSVGPASSRRNASRAVLTTRVEREAAMGAVGMN